MSYEDTRQGRLQLREVTAELCIASVACVRWRLAVTLLLRPSLFPTPHLLHPPALPHKSAVVYENLQHRSPTLRLSPASHWLRSGHVCWRREQELFIYNFQ